VSPDLKEENKNDCNDSGDGNMDGSCQIEKSHDIDVLKLNSKDQVIPLAPKNK
jgi:hypothetical protein